MINFRFSERATLFIHSFYSLIMHAVILFFLLTFPLYGIVAGKTDIFRQYFVYLSSEETPAKLSPEQKVARRVISEKSKDVVATRNRAEDIRPADTEKGNMEKVIATRNREDTERAESPPEETIKEDDMKTAASRNREDIELSGASPAELQTESMVVESNAPEVQVVATRNREKPSDLQEKTDGEGRMMEDEARMPESVVQDVSAASPELQNPDMQEIKAPFDILNGMMLAPEGEVVAARSRDETEGITQTEVVTTRNREAETGLNEKPAVEPVVSEALFSNAIVIEVFLDGNGTPEVIMHLLREDYPAAGRYDSQPSSMRSRRRQEEVHAREEIGDALIGGKTGSKRILSFATAEKGIYNFVIENKGEKAYAPEVLFKLYEGESRERIKSYKALHLSSGETLRFKFILPDAVFWDDEDRFAGTIENSNTITKFNYEGLIWEEEKDY